MDGTIVDTEPLWMAAETRMVESFGGSWTYDDALQLVGKGLEDSAGILRAAGVQREVDDIVQSLTAEVSDQLRAGAAVFRPGAVELLRELRASGIRTGLVTMSLRSMADAVIDLLDAPVFDVIVTGDTSRRPKPFPDPYLQAAEELGVDIADTLVIEDSPSGLRSGVASGAVTLGVPHMVSLDGLGADALWPTLENRRVADLAALFIAHRRTPVQAVPRA